MRGERTQVLVVPADETAPCRLTEINAPLVNRIRELLSTRRNPRSPGTTSVTVEPAVYDRDAVVWVEASAVFVATVAVLLILARLLGSSTRWGSCTGISRASETLAVALHRLHGRTTGHGGPVCRSVRSASDDQVQAHSRR